MGLFGDEGSGGDDEVDEGTESAVVFLHVGNGGVEESFVRVSHFATQGIGEHFSGEAAKEEIFFFKKLALKAGDAHEFGAVGHLGGGVDDGIVLTNAAFVAKSFLEAEFAGGIVVLEREAEGIDLVVASRALRELAVDGEALPDGGLVDTGNFGSDLTDVFDRETGVGAKEVFENPGAPDDGRGAGSI